MLVIEPGSSLINTLSNKVCRERRFKFFLVLKRIMPLRVRHRATIKPGIKHIRSTFHRRATLFAWHGYLIHDMLVEIIHFYSARRFKFSDGTKNFFLATFAKPKRHDTRPKTLTANRPITRTLKPLPKAPFFHVLGRPMDILSKFQHLWLQLGHFYKPRACRIVQERCVAAPTVWVAMRNIFF